MLFAPQIINPRFSDIFNFGVVSISWSINDPPSTEDVDNDYVTYEIEYTDNYKKDDTVWRTVKRRIPWSQESYSWTVGKMIKGSDIHIRMRAYSSSDYSFSDWSISDSFSVNVFNLVAPEIVNPVPKTLYTDFIQIILDESQIVNTYHQKVRYSLQYSSHKRDIDWTTIISDLPVGNNVIRWDIENLPSSDDYILRLSTEAESTNIAYSFVYDIYIQQLGLFYIDTKPPAAILEIENNSRVTNEVNQVINIFAEDETTRVEEIRLRECGSDGSLILGNIERETTSDCPEPTDASSIGRPLNNSTKIKWTFSPHSGLRKIEAILVDSGGNSSLMEKTNVFTPIFDSSSQINDFITLLEDRYEVIPNDNGFDTSTAVYEVAYFCTSTGDLWILEPFARLIYNIPNVSLKKLIFYGESIYIGAYDASNDVGYLYRHNSTEPVETHEFTGSLSIISSFAEYNNKLYIGMKNGQLWKYDGTSVTSVTITTTDPINTLYSDDNYLYVGFENADGILIYDNTNFTFLNF